MNNKSYDFINQPTKKSLLKMFLPMMIGMVLNLAYNLVDSLWIGNLLGDSALASLTDATPVVTLMFSFGMGITNGMAILLSQVTARGNKDEENKIVSSTFLYTIIISVILTVVLELLLPYILRLLQTPKEAFDNARQYLIYYFIGLIPSYIFCHLTAMLRCYGDTVFQMVAMLVTSIVNAVLDPVLIKAIGFSGAAIATVISQVLSLVIVLIYCKKKHYFTISFKAMKKSLVPSVCKLSIPTVIQQCAPSVSSMVLTACVNGFSTAAIAAYGITTKLDMILFFPPMVMNMILTPIVGFCVGGGRKDRASDYVKFSLILSVIIVGVFGVILLFCSKPVAGMFGCSDEAATIVQRGLYFITAGYILNAITQSFMGKINGYGHPASCMIITLVNHIVIRIPLSILLSMTALGLDGIWTTLLISFVVAFICVIIINIVTMKKEAKKGVVASDVPVENNDIALDSPCIKK